MGDFGLSINITEESATSRVGTLEFMAPEVLDCPTKRYPREYKDNPKYMYSNKVCKVIVIIQYIIPKIAFRF